MTTAPASDYEHTEQDERCREAWRTAPKSFISAAARLGIGMDLAKKTGAAIEYDATRHSASYEVDLSGMIDRTVDFLIEKHQDEKLVRDVVASLEEPMQREAERVKAHTIVRIVCFLVNCPKGNVLARIHAILHAIPGLAESENFGSMRESARVCGVSPEWMSQSREKWCDFLGVPVPVKGQKSDVAKSKYRSRISWRHRTMQTA